MTSLQPGSRVLVTGASGFVASHVVRALLRCGCHVRGTVRDPSDAYKVDALRAIAAAEGASDALELVRADLLDASSFTDIATDCDAVAHTASPFTFADITDVEAQLIAPAVEGTRSVVEACRASASVKRLVVTSSFASVWNNIDAPQHVYTEDDWTFASTAKDGAFSAYMFSKRVAEEAAWEDVAKSGGANPNLTIATICPPMVLGPVIHAPRTVRDLNTSAAMLHKYWSGAQTTMARGGNHWVDVRDVADAHVAALGADAAAGKRFLVGGTWLNWHAMCALIEADPAAAGGASLAVDIDAALAAKDDAPFAISDAAARRDLAFMPRPINATVRDACASFAALQQQWEEA